MNLAHMLRKYFIMGSNNCMIDPSQTLEKAIEGGITAFQFREKGKGSLKGKERYELGFQLRQICSDHSIPFFANDDMELAEVLEADGIHIGQEDESLQRVRDHFPHKWIGLSVSNWKEVENSPLHIADYLGAGPIYDTDTKEDAKKAVGLKWLSQLRLKYPDLPIVGIGGIDHTNSSEVLQAGANGVAVISAITQAESIIERVNRL